jgi:hypothetical protein
MTLGTAGLVATLFLCGSSAFAGQAANPHAGGHAAPRHGQHVGELDINTASADELKTIPGLSEAQVKKIVESRPYKRKDELVTKKILPLATYERIKDHIATGPSKQ